MCVDGMTMAEVAADRLIPVPSQWPEFYSWAHDAFALTDDSWDPAGAGEPWNGSKPYGKMIHAIYLLAFALRDEYIPQWHARADYLDAARAIDNSYRGPFYLRFLDDSDAEAISETGRVAARDRTDYKCPLFHRGAISDDPANRASVMVHESWAPLAAKVRLEDRSPNRWCDHRRPGGRLVLLPRLGSVRLRHPVDGRCEQQPAPVPLPYQVSIGFDADLAEFSFGWVPTIVRDQARFYGNVRLASQCKNRTSYRIGNPRPF